MTTILPDFEPGYAEINGAKLYYEIAGSGTPLILVHGFSLDRRMWDGLHEEEDAKERRGLSLAQEDARPARTGLHGSPTGRKWKETYERGDEFFDWDGHAFHFVGGIATGADGSLALYRPKEAGAYLKELMEALANSTLP